MKQKYIIFARESKNDLLVPVLYAFLPGKSVEISNVLLKYLTVTPLIPQDREKYFEMDLECLVLKEILGNFRSKFCFAIFKKGMRKNYMSKVGKKVGGRR